LVPSAQACPKYIVKAIVSPSRSALQQPPECWHSRALTDGKCRLIDVTGSMKRRLESMFKRTSHRNGCGGSDGLSKTRDAEITRIVRIENPTLWREYQQCLQTVESKSKSNHNALEPLEPRVPASLSDPFFGLRDDLNEVMAFHGTKWEMADQIAQGGLDERFSIQGLYGAGIYLATQACKASQYADRNRESGEIKVFVCRVVLGDVAYTKHHRVEGTARLPPARTNRKTARYDSVVANQGDNTQYHRELIVYDRRQVYPEFMVYIRTSLA